MKRKTKKVQATCNLPASLLQAVDALAEKHFCSRGSIIRMLLQRGLQAEA